MDKKQQKAQMKKPIIQEYFGENTTLEEIYLIYFKSPELFKYAQALDKFIDDLIDLRIDYAKQKVKERDEQWIKEIYQLKMTTYPNPLDTLIKIMKEIKSDLE